jgi:predicted nucleotidyltransferase
LRIPHGTEERSVEREAVLNCIGDILASFSGVQVAYVYGSFLTREDFRDIDIALFLDEDLSPAGQESLGEAIGISVEEALAFRHTCDVRVLNRAPVWFQYEVIRTGRAVYARTDEERFDRETTALVAYMDMKYTYDLFDAGYLARA